jgi:hypothetical protein
MSSSTIDIYDGRRFLGHVIERDGAKRCDAYSATGQAIGVFPSPAMAARAVYETAIDQQHGVTP